MSAPMSVAARGGVDDDERTANGNVEGDVERGSFASKGFMESILYRMGLADVRGDVGIFYLRTDNKLGAETARLRSRWLYGGLCVLSYLLMAPMWNTNRLITDPAFMFFAGTTIPRAFISVCFSIPAFYVCTVSITFKRGALHTLNELNLIQIFAAFLGFLGFWMVLMSLPMYYHSVNTYREIVYDCTSGYGGTRELYQTSQALQVLRRQATCAGLVSVDQCPGFQKSVYTDTLLNMEISYKCSGYCYDPTALEKAARVDEVSKVSSLMRVANRNLSVSLIGVSRHERAGRSRRHSNQKHLVGIDSEGPIDFRAEDIVEEAVQEATSVEVNMHTPKPGQPATGDAVKDEGVITQSRVAASPPPSAPTLIGSSSSQISCDSVAAKFMRHSLGDMATQTFSLGCVSIAASVAMGVAVLKDGKSEAAL